MQYVGMGLVVMAMLLAVVLIVRKNSKGQKPKQGLPVPNTSPTEVVRIRAAALEAHMRKLVTPPPSSSPAPRPKR